MKTFQQIVSERFSLHEKDINDSMTMHDIPGWDSMNFLLLIADIEKELSISFTMDEVLAFNSLGDIRTLAEKKSATT